MGTLKTVNIGENIRLIFGKLGREQKVFFGGPPYSEEINREIRNNQQYQLNGLPNRQRICVGTYVLNQSGDIVGYQASTAMESASITGYEKTYLDLVGPVNYVQLKKILVDPDYFGKGVSDKLLGDSMDMANAHDKDWVVEVNSNNVRMLHFLNKHSVSKRFEWKTRKDTLMYRLGKD
ncbi:hypothetical protein HN747_02810 [archaeon]|nr:hypothetical protein [archaeon]